MPIYTVLGPIAPDELGRTSMHEHLLCDTRVWLTPATERPSSDRVEMSTLGFLRWNVAGLEDNLVIDEPDAVVDELSAARVAGASAVVDLTVVGIGRDVARLPDVSRRSGVHVIAGCGFYLDVAHPSWVEDAAVEAIAAVMTRELVHGVDDTGIRPGMIGEIGTGHAFTAAERKVVLGAGIAAASTGAAVNVHLDRRGDHAVEVVRMLTGEGVPADRIVLSHMDYQSLERNLEAVATGAVVEYDTFGSEVYYGSLGFKDPTDLERLGLVQAMVERGFASQIVLGCDTWTKTGLARYGGLGYRHLFARIAPLLTSRHGVPPEAITDMLEGTPRRILDRPAVETLA